MQFRWVFSSSKLERVALFLIDPPPAKGLFTNYVSQKGGGPRHPPPSMSANVSIFQTPPPPLPANVRIFPTSPILPFQPYPHISLPFSLYDKKLLTKYFNAVTLVIIFFLNVNIHIHSL